MMGGLPRGLFPVLLTALLCLLTLAGAEDPYSYTLTNGAGVTLSDLTSGDVLNLDLLETIQIQVSYPQATRFQFSGISASTDGVKWSSIPDIKSSHTQPNPPYFVFRKGSSSNPINLRTLLQTKGFKVYSFVVQEKSSIAVTFTFYVSANSSALCQQIQEGKGNGPICKNRGNCTANQIGSSCSCPSNFAGVDCSACASGFTGTNCSQCLSSYYGPSCLACPNCGSAGTCNQGITGNGRCTCSQGWNGTYCNVCARGYSGQLCTDCAAGFYGPNCTACISCENGSCNAGKTGNGTCSCNHGWKLASGSCTDCASGFYGSSCTQCPSCGSHGACDEGKSGTGTCICKTGWASASGGACNFCAPGFYGPNCIACPNCGPKGTCSEGLTGTGTCVCATGWAGASCNACAPGYYGPSCLPCPNCGSMGACNDGQLGNGVCTCQAGWISFGGGNCNACEQGYFGPRCTPCPFCGNGVCSEGWPGDLGGNGTCLCDAGWVGVNGGPCLACDNGFYGPSCARCPNCGSRGSCDQGLPGDTGGTGACVCQAGWTSVNGGVCNACADGYYGPSCLPCPKCGQGTCDQGVAGDTGGSGTCICAAGWASSSSGPCSVCAPGYYGASCTKCPHCSNGVCSEGLSGTGQCVCNLGWALDPQGDCLVCASNFAGPNCDECAPGFYGPSCAACPTCPAHSICSSGRSNNGSCICEVRWTGPSCSLCAPGFTGSNCDQCLPGHYGPSCLPCRDCLHGLCADGIQSDGRCDCSLPYALAASGLCDACADKFYGPDCLPCPDCGPNGSCDQGVAGDRDGTGSCNCKTGSYSSEEGECDLCSAGYYGPSCLPCPNCGSKGTCRDGVTGNGTCACALGWDSANGGICNICSPGFEGPSCTSCSEGLYPNCFVGIDCPNDCQGHGTCNRRIGACTCDIGFQGTDCGACRLESDTYPSCTKGMVCSLDCSENGYCDTNYGTCKCDPGFAGSSCGECAPGYAGHPECYRAFECPQHCSDHGTCNDRTGVCACQPFYEGDDCSSCVAGHQAPSEGCWEVFECPSEDCSGNGHCDIRSGVCSCVEDYTGPSCNLKLHCNSNPCQNGGSCSETATHDRPVCSCPPGFKGESCQFIAVAPLIDSVTPLVVLASGGELEVVASFVQAPLKISLFYGSTPLGEVIVTDIQPLGSRLGSFSTFIFQTPPSSVRGYVRLTFTNPGGQSVDFDGLFLTLVCPEKDSFYLNGSCSSCPQTAVCPGGDRIYPDPGYWSPDSQTPPIKCPPPEARCVGGMDSACAPGYFGELCAFCDNGYAKNPETNACEACPNFKCADIRPLTPSLYFFLGCIALLLISFLASIIYRLQQMRTKRQQERNRLSMRIQLLSTIRKKRRETLREHEISYNPEAQPAFGDDLYEEERLLSMDDAADSPREARPLGALGASAHSYVDAEAICIDAVLNSLPRYGSLYSRIMTTVQSDLAFARITQQVTEKILRDHDEIFGDDNGQFIGFPNHILIQNLVDKYIERFGWKVFGSLHAQSKKGSFGQPFFQRHVSDLPYTFQVSHDRGVKSARENRWFAQLFAHEMFGFGDKNNISVIGVYDGFGGPQAAEHVSKYLHVNILRNDHFKKDTYTAIKEGHLETNNSFDQVIQAERLPDVVGCSSIFGMIFGKELWISWVGDCQAVLYRKSGEIMSLCEPHTHENDAEVQRIEALGGGFSEKGGIMRVGGIFPTTRAFGCERMSKFLVPEPEILLFELQGNEKHLIFANGPFWKFIHPSVIPPLLKEFEDGGVTGLAEGLMEYARSLGCMENLTVSILTFK